MVVLPVSDVISLSDIDLLQIGNELQLWGCIFAGSKDGLIVPLPDQDREISDFNLRVLKMDTGEMERFLNQSDVQDVQGPGKAILRKSQRQISTMISWEVFARDGYKCRYCGRRLPLTVDHVDRWEEGGATVPANLITACKSCNQHRGAMPYDTWMISPDYRRTSKMLTQIEREINTKVILTLPYLKTLRVNKVRSR